MTDAYIFDHARTPRGRGRPDGSLHEISAVQLAAQVLQALAERQELDTSRIDDVVFGCAQPVGEQGGNIGRGIANSSSHLVCGANDVPRIGNNLSQQCARDRPNRVLKCSKSRRSTREACRKENLTNVIDAESDADQKRDSAKRPPPVTHEFGIGPRVVARWPQENFWATSWQCILAFI